MRSHAPDGQQRSGGTTVAPHPPARREPPTTRGATPQGPTDDAALRASGASRGPAALPPATILRLQQSAGNRAVVELVGSATTRARTASPEADAAPRAAPPGPAVQRGLLDTIGEAAGGAIGAVADAARTAWSRGTGTVRAAASAAREVAARVAGVATGVGRAAADTAGGGWRAVTRTVADAGQAVAEGARTAWNAATDVAGEVVGRVADLAGRGFDRLGDMARRAASGVSEIAGNVWSAVAGAADKVWGGVRDMAGSAWETVGNVASGAWRAATRTAARVAEGVRSLAAAAWGGIRSAAGELWDEVAGGLRSLWTSITSGVGRAVKGIAERVSIPGLDVRSRPLTSSERAYAERIFGDTLDYEAIVITRGSIMSAGSARATGNAVNLAERDFEGDTMALSDHGYTTLIHEMTHVFQYQHGGLGYMPESLWVQFKAWVTTGDRNAAYEWRPLAAAGVAWERWNVEQQAAAVEDYNIELRKMEQGRAFDAVVLARLGPYVEHMRSGPRRAAAGGARPAASPTPAP